MHITSLPSPYGIGTLGDEAEKFADWLQMAGQSLWEVLPISPAGRGNDPYQPTSAFAGNPLLIGLDELCRRDLLTQEECEAVDFGADPEYTDYDKIIKTRDVLHRKAFSRFTDDVGYTSFCLEQSDWLDDYALFNAIKNHFGGKPWTDWDDDIRFRSPGALARYSEELRDEVRYIKWRQYVFSRQWTRFHSACGGKGIRLIGEIPFSLQLDSADVWAHPELFDLDDSLRPRRVAASPPDQYSKSGYVLGDPLYNWENFRALGFDWWIKRIKRASEMFDIIKLERFGAFDSQYVVPYGEKNAENGTWENVPGEELFAAVSNAVGNLCIIADDQCGMTEGAKDLMAKTGFSATRVLQNGFNSKFSDNNDLPHRYPQNSACYTSTQNTATMTQWHRETDARSRAMAKAYLGKKPLQKISARAIEACCFSPSDIAIITVQDILGLGRSARMNDPSSAGENWTWRIKKTALKPSAAKKLRVLAERSLRTGLKSALREGEEGGRK